MPTTPKARTSSRHEADSGDLRRKILLAASDVFWKEGYEQASMRKIAQGAGCSAGNLYWYFKDKDDLLDSICEETFQRLGETMHSFDKSKLEPLQALMQGTRIYMEFGVANPAHYAATFLIQRKNETDDANCSIRREVIGRNCFDDLIRAVARAADAGLLVEKPIEEIAQAIWAAAHGAVALLISMPAPWIYRDRLIANVSEMTILGFAKR